MRLFIDDVGQSVRGAWDLVQRKRAGMARFDFSERGFWRSFLSIALCAPAFVALLAAERVRLGLAGPGSGLFDDPALTARMALLFIASWLMPLLAGWAIASLLGLRRRLVAFVVAQNWAGVVAAGFLGLPALLYAAGLADQAHALVYTGTFMIIVAHLRWMTTKVALGVSGGVAALVTGAALGGEFALQAMMA